MLWALYEGDFGWHFRGVFDSRAGAHDAALQLQRSNSSEAYVPPVFVVNDEEEAGQIHNDSGFYVVRPIPLNGLVP